MMIYRQWLAQFHQVVCYWLWETVLQVTQHLNHGEMVCREVFGGDKINESGEMLLSFCALTSCV